MSKAREKSIYATRLADLFSNEIVQSLIDSKRFESISWHKGFLPPILRCVVRKFGISKIRALSSETLKQKAT